MDKFEEKMEKLTSAGLSDEEIEKKLLDELGDLCICPDCPMFNQCAEKNYEGVYCILGLSKCKLEEDDCICPDCEVAEELELKNDLFCIKGPEKELREL
ncbi:MAG: hypothetical protein PWQ15_204 [Methanobacterium sp.]|jgi:hypothetical protein|uniref:DUF2769 domain-containing protein n=1 Tax=Methanobacterium sp. TaxID=2164 RepID=UPI0003C9609F|nr:DUF2769 domain-containing protein [Methanobacterium sp.]MDI3549102.1 hypothetical protein [Methanobacterium sp.]CDG64302.1 hypothetical protein MBMB1_0184 [Methanobacterium sp. MB1]